MVGIGKSLCGNVPGIFPWQTVNIHQKAHEFGNSNGRVGIVQLNGHLVGKYREVGMVLQKRLQNFLQGCGCKEILLF